MAIRRTLPLTEAARLTGQPVERLRQWCATGLLSCDRIAGEWALLESELPTAHSLASVGPRLATKALPDGARLIAVAFRDHVDARRALDEIRTRVGVHPTDVELAPLSIDGMPRVLVAGRVPARHLARIASIVSACGGQILDGQPGAGADGDAVDEEDLAFDFGA